MGFHRKQMTRKSSRRSFGKNAVRTHKRNVSGRPMRGGIRL